MAKLLNTHTLTLTPSHSHTLTPPHQLAMALSALSSSLSHVVGIGDCLESSQALLLQVTEANQKLRVNAEGRGEGGDGKRGWRGRGWEEGVEGEGMGRGGEEGGDGKRG